MLNSSASLLYLGLVLWNAGMTIGFPMTVASSGDAPAIAAGGSTPNRIGTGVLRALALS